jgi:hypothetical protein
MFSDEFDTLAGPEGPINLICIMPLKSVKQSQELHVSALRGDLLRNFEGYDTAK